MNMNPIEALDNLLADYASPKVRRLIHSLLFLGLAIAVAVLTFDGDWVKALVAAAGLVYAALNKANTPGTDLDPAGVTSESDDGLSYEQSGGQPFPEPDHFDPVTGEPVYLIDPQQQ